MTSLKDELIGTWKLLSYIEVPIQGEDSLFPMGKTPSGVLIHSADGYMSMQISKQERQLFVSNDKLQATLEEMRSTLTDYTAFCAKYTVDLNNAIITYHIESSLFPNWTGQKQLRRVDFEGDIMYLKSTEAILSNGQNVNSYMTWQRVNTLDEVNLLEEQALIEL